MEIGTTLYVTNRTQWRSWLAKNNKKEKEIWLVYYRKSSGKKRIPYDEAVEEALCYGWIDSTMKRIDEERFAQRFTPRRKTSQLSELNKGRIRKMMKQGKMTKAGLDAVSHVFDKDEEGGKGLTISEDILQALKRDKETWENFQGFPEAYRRIRIDWIERARTRPELFRKRLRYFFTMTASNKRYGAMP